MGQAEELHACCNEYLQVPEQLLNVFEEEERHKSIECLSLANAHEYLSQRQTGDYR